MSLQQVAPLCVDVAHVLNVPCPHSADTCGRARNMRSQEWERGAQSAHATVFRRLSVATKPTGFQPVVLLVVVPRLEEIDPSLAHLVYQPVFLGDSSGPCAGKDVLQRLRFTDPEARISQNRF